MISLQWYRWSTSMTGAVAESAREYVVIDSFLF